MVLFYTPGTFAQDAFRHIKNLGQNSTLDDVINIYENLCTVVFNTVSAYSVWFVVHWLSYGAGVVLSVIYISKEFLERNKYGTPTLNLVYLGSGKPVVASPNDGCFLRIHFRMYSNFTETNEIGCAENKVLFSLDYLLL